MRSDVIMELDLLPGASRGYWKYHAPGKWFKQPKAVGKLNNARVALLFDPGAEVCIVDSIYARKVGCHIDDSQTQECVEGRTKIKATLAGTPVYYFDAWVGSLSDQEAILGMAFMVPARIRLDLADGTLCLPDELVQDIEIPVANSVEVPIYSRMSDRQKLWITRGERLGRRRYFRTTNWSDQPLTLFDDTWIGIWLSGDHIPRHAGFVSIGSRRYDEWQSLAYKDRTDQPEDAGVDDVTSGPSVERPQYDHPTRILTRQANHPKVATIQATKSKGEPKIGPSEAGIKREERKEVGKVIAEEPESPMPEQTEMRSEDQDSLQCEIKN
ncbi:hypothetical protein PHPALM_28411 [Phytophthora palmivora]|uniref:Eukaryotic/viral aspartic protease n=1 Tax=Phytophthora palmivora TaxID=4796 RepID=A0A2P4XAA3_9STRA|nr:hypothetical protein PHPALM_28411 [Phytophthora palmivora]